jgi:hypothetical protein
MWASEVCQRLGILGLVATITAAGCRPSDVLSVPAPAGVIASGTLANQAGAESNFGGAKGQFFYAADGDFFTGLLTWSSLLADEFTFSGFSSFASFANVDARITASTGGFEESGDRPWGYLLQARSGLLLAIPQLAQYEPASGRSKIGEAYALVGYAELLLAESYCAGTPLDAVVQGGGIHYGTPLTTDSLFGVAEVHFDSAMAEANGDATVLGLASVGLGRVLLDRGQYAAAATAVMNVPTNFVYNVTLNGTVPPYNANIYGYVVLEGAFGAIFNVANGEGENGLDFIAARDPRLMLDSTTYETLDGGVWYLPTKFENDLVDVPLATGVEAGLIAAEAALQANPGEWLADLNALRAAAPSTYLNLDSALAPLADPGTDSGRVSLMFRERAFWLFGTGTRLGDLRRLVREYGRDQSKVYPTGPYANGNNPNLPAPIPNYGTDVDLTLPTPASGTTITNPNYKGCLTSTKIA